MILEMPCIFPKALFNLNILCYTPWCFLSFMMVVVAGPTKTRLANPAKKMVATGARTLQRFASAKVPLNDDAAPRAPGYVNASTAGRAVCMPK